MKTKVVSLLLLGLLCFFGTVQGQTRYQPYTISFTSTQTSPPYTNPFDFNEVAFSVTFSGPGSLTMTVPGFWDGGLTWKVRFSPPVSGSWSYTSACSNVSDTGLNGITGSFTAASAPTSGNLINQHGGILQLNGTTGRNFTYQDGTPFFYIADTWWGAPNYRMPFDVSTQNSTTNIDTSITGNAAFSWATSARAAQGFTVLQMHGSQGMKLSEPTRDKFEYILGTLDNTDPGHLEYWQTYDQYIADAYSKGFVINLGVAQYTTMDGVSLDLLKRLFRNIYARYGAYPIINLVTQEYNGNPGFDVRGPILRDLCAYLSTLDDYHRVIGLHLIPDTVRNYVDPSWDESWNKCMIVQAGHFVSDQAKGYYWRYFKENLPLLESETNYEGFISGNFICSPKVVRNSAYTAIQAGSFGFGYGASGSYSTAYNGSGQPTTWGPVPNWWDSINNTAHGFDGATQMQWVKKCYEKVNWWNLVPNIAAIPENFNLLVKSEGYQTFLIWYPDSVSVAAGIKLLGTAYNGAIYSVEWFDPITGNSVTGTPITTGATPGLVLPSRPNPLSVSSGVLTGSILGSTQDWMLILKYVSGGTTPPAAPTSVTPTVSWDFLSGTEGWAMAPSTTNAAPTLLSPASLTIDATRNKVIKIRLRNQTSSVHGIVSFTTTATGEGAFTTDKRKVFQMVPLDASFTDYYVDMYDVAKWTGTVNRIQLTLGDSSLSGTTNGGSYNVNVASVQVGYSGAGSLTSEWPFDNNSNDIIGGRNATLTGTTYSTDAITGGYSLSLNGSSDFGTAGNVLDPQSGNYSLSFWFKRGTTTAADQAIMSKGNASSILAGWSVFLASADNKIYARANGSNDSTLRAGQTGPVVNNTDWHHAVMTIDRTNNVILGYLDGIRTGWVNGGSGPTSNSLTGWSAIGTTNEFRFGNVQNGGTNSLFFNGLLDDVRVYTDVLSANDVARLSLTSAYWRLDNNTVDSVSNDNLSLTDAGCTFVAGGKIGGSQCLSLDGIYGAAIGNTTLDPALGSYTVVGWFKRSRSGTIEMLASKGNKGSTTKGWSIWIDTDNTLIVRCNASNSTAQRASQHGPAVNDANWHMVTLVIDRGSNVIKGYLDGSGGWTAGGGGPSSDSISSFGSIDSPEKLVLGSAMLSGVLSTPFAGQLDDVRIFNRALSPSEIAALASQ